MKNEKFLGRTRQEMIMTLNFVIMIFSLIYILMFVIITLSYFPIIKNINIYIPLSIWAVALVSLHPTMNLMIFIVLKIAKSKQGVKDGG